MLKKFLLYVLLVPVFIRVDAQPGDHRLLQGQHVTSDSVLAGIDLENSASWFAASVPGHQPALFPEASAGIDFKPRVNCARIAWYIIDPLFYDKNTALLPPHMVTDPDSRSGFYVCMFFENELFPEMVPVSGAPVNLAILNMAFYPGEKGLFNYDAAPGVFSAGIDSSGHLKNHQSRWGGIMRALEDIQLKPHKDTVADTYIKVKYIDFWLMDPFVESPQNTGGQLFFNLGDVSEDILNPGVLDIEKGDTGYDNMNDEAERFAFKPYLDSLSARFGQCSAAYTDAAADPSCDRYHYFRGSDYDHQALGILDRYKLFNGPEGNSTLNDREPYPTIATTIPNTEDINRNAVLDTAEAYYQYAVNLLPSALAVGKNHITEARTVTTTFINGVTASVRWFHFQIPVSQPDTVIGNFGQVDEARFMRIFLKGFNTETHLRFATLELSYLKELAYRDRISVYPNPTQGMLTIDFDNRTPRSVTMYDHQGRLLFTQETAAETGKVVTLDLSVLSDGAYILQLVTDQETLVKKVIVAK